MSDIFDVTVLQFASNVLGPIQRDTVLAAGYTLSHLRTFLFAAVGDTLLDLLRVWDRRAALGERTAVDRQEK